MIEDGVEVIVGVQHDPVFGPVIMAGLGGIFVEVLEDVSFRVAPLTLADAGEMLRELRAFPLLAGARNTDPVDLEALCALIVNVGRLAVERAGSLRELDLNPIKAGARGAIAVDVLAVEALA